ncbi:MAG: hypothetical protein KH352_06205 [Ruminococcus sp.]|nr:hypothetical protein [Candidatus Apopatosoma intestinale]
MGNKKTVSKSLFVIVVVALAILLVASVSFCSYSRKQYQYAQRRIEVYQKQALSNILLLMSDPSKLSEQAKDSYRLEKRMNIAIAMDMYSWDIQSDFTSFTNTELFGVISPLVIIFNSDAWQQMDAETVNMLREYGEHILKPGGVSKPLSFEIADLYAKLQELVKLQ